MIIYIYIYIYKWLPDSSVILLVIELPPAELRCLLSLKSLRLLAQWSEYSSESLWMESVGGLRCSLTSNESINDKQMNRLDYSNSVKPKPTKQRFCGFHPVVIFQTQILHWTSSNDSTQCQIWQLWIYSWFFSVSCIGATICKWFKWQIIFVSKCLYNLVWANLGSAPTIIVLILVWVIFCVPCKTLCRIQWS